MASCCCRSSTRFSRRDSWMRPTGCAANGDAAMALYARMGINETAPKCNRQCLGSAAWRVKRIAPRVLVTSPTTVC